MIKNILIVVQLISSVLLIVFVLLQSKGTGLGSIFGGEGNIYRTRRGLEKGLFVFTIITALVFAVTAFLNVLIH